MFWANKCIFVKVDTIVMLQEVTVNGINVRTMRILYCSKSFNRSETFLKETVVYYKTNTTLVRNLYLGC